MQVAEGIGICENIVIYHSPVIAPAVRSFSMLGPPVGSVDRIQEIIRVNPSPVHADRGFKIQMVREIDLRIARHDGSVRRRVIVLRSCYILGRGGQVRTVELCPVPVWVGLTPRLCVSRSVDDTQHDSGTVGTCAGNNSVILIMRICHVRANREPLIQIRVNVQFHVVSLIVSDSEYSFFICVATAKIEPRFVAGI